MNKTRSNGNVERLMKLMTVTRKNEIAHKDELVAQNQTEIQLCRQYQHLFRDKNSC